MQEGKWIFFCAKNGRISRIRPIKVELCVVTTLIAQVLKLFAQAGFPPVQIIAERLTAGFKLKGKLVAPGSEIFQQAAVI